ncbi:type II toxin-antitoxin system RelE/ParE family toxin [Bosea sp. (in: a-proteobacteria)]|jgi:putative addiction module killer protein|uniref:type II toxin-antitoxin system RelE/ParE family toxin n=1 Tax=Bosea sp. (in: a-proteobacteria) TaxID=1871050 RepID=UPI003F6F332B
MISVRQTVEFRDWLTKLGDGSAVRRVLQRIARIEIGNFGDAKFFDGIGELRIDAGPGYRVYFVKRGAAVVILLCGGDKSTQRRDIRRAVDMAKEV